MKRVRQAGLSQKQRAKENQCTTMASRIGGELKTKEDRRGLEMVVAFTCDGGRRQVMLALVAIAACSADALRLGS